MMKITLTLTEEEIQRALIILSNAPYKDIADVIDKIKNQANAQIFAENER